MARITFDTLAYANKLKLAGVESKHAEAQAEAQAELLSELMDDRLATKEDVKLLKDDINHVLQKLEQIEYKLTIKLGGLLIAAVGALAALMTILNHH